MIYITEIAEKYSLQITERLLVDAAFSQRMGIEAEYNKRTLYEQIAEQAFTMAEAMARRAEQSPRETP